MALQVRRYGGRAGIAKARSSGGGVGVRSPFGMIGNVEQRFTDPFGSGKTTKKIDPFFDKFATAKRGFAEQGLAGLKRQMSGALSTEAAQGIRASAQQRANQFMAETGARPGSFAAAAAKTQARASAGSDVAKMMGDEQKQRIQQQLSFAPIGGPSKTTVEKKKKQSFFPSISGSRSTYVNKWGRNHRFAMK